MKQPTAQHLPLGRTPGEVSLEGIVTREVGIGRMGYRGISFYPFVLGRSDRDIANDIATDNDGFTDAAEDITDGNTACCLVRVSRMLLSHQLRELDSPYGVSLNNHSFATQSAATPAFSTNGSIFSANGCTALTTSPVF